MICVYVRETPSFPWLCLMLRDESYSLYEVYDKSCLLSGGRARGHLYIILLAPWLKVRYMLEAFPPRTDNFFHWISALVNMYLLVAAI